MFPGGPPAERANYFQPAEPGTDINRLKILLNIDFNEQTRQQSVATTDN